MFKLALLSTALVVGLVAAGCSSGSDDSNTDSPEANAAASTVAHINVPFCAAGEQTIFACATENNKQLAVCAKNVTTPGGYIEYRFGPANQSEKTVTFPVGYFDDSEPEAVSYGLNFKSGDIVYQVYEIADNHEARAFAEGGVHVLQNGNQLLATVKCAGDNFGDMDMETVRAAGVRLEPQD